MTKNEIVEQLFRGKDFNECIGKMEPEHLREDLRQEVILIVCGWDDEKIKGLHERGELSFYVARVIIQQIQSNTSPFYKKYRQINSVFESERKLKANDSKDSDLTEYTKVEVKNMAQYELVAHTVELTDFEERLIREEVEDIAIESIDKLYWYDAEMVRLYMKVGSFRAMEKETKIPYTSCFKTVQRALQELKRRATEPAARPEPLFSRTEIKTLRG